MKYSAFDIIVTRNETLREDISELLQTAEVLSISPFVSETVGADVDTAWKNLASCADSDMTEMVEILYTVLAILEEVLELPAFCTVAESPEGYKVIPSVSMAVVNDAVPLDDYPEEYVGDYIMVVNDHGNVTCQEWNYQKNEYITIWDMV